MRFYLLLLIFAAGGSKHSHYSSEIEHELMLIDPTGLSFSPAMLRDLSSQRAVPRALGDLNVGNLTVSPVSVPDGGYVTVSVSSTAPRSTDWLGVWSPSMVKINETTPVKWMSLNRAD